MPHPLGVEAFRSSLLVLVVQPIYQASHINYSSYNKCWCVLYHSNISSVLHFKFRYGGFSHSFASNWRSCACFYIGWNWFTLIYCAGNATQISSLQSCCLWINRITTFSCTQKFCLFLFVFVCVCALQHLCVSIMGICVCIYAPNDQGFAFE